jgi:acetolactate synthase-1/2/3 large subunit
VNGATRLLRTLVANGVDLVIGNPGTSEMQFVHALDAVPQMRAVLALFEGVASGAADGFGRMADRPAATLFHLGPGLGNGLANLHNARRARTPVVNIVGDHATFHRRFDAPLNSDIEAVARTVSAWLRTCASADAVSIDAAEATAAAREAQGQIATLLLPADVAWSATTGELETRSPRPPAAVAESTVERIASVLRRGEPTALLLNGRALREPQLVLASRIAKRTGARMVCDTFPARLERGVGRPAVQRLPYFGEMVLGALDGLKHLVLVGARAPVAFFAFPDRPSSLVPGGCHVHTLADEVEDCAQALQSLAEAVGATDAPDLQPLAVPPAPTGGAIDPHSLAAAIAATLPDGAIVVDEANTAGFAIPMATAGCRPHDWLCLTGGSIGMGLPVATGAALACPGRRVVALEGDGSALYTAQALWTQAREELDVTNVVLVNRSYAILNIEMTRMGLGAAGPIARTMLDLTHPEIDLASLGRSLGVPSQRAETADQLIDLLRRSFAARGPTLIEAILA